MSILTTDRNGVSRLLLLLLLAIDFGRPNVTDLIVQVGQNQPLDCSLDGGTRHVWCRRAVTTTATTTTTTMANYETCFDGDRYFTANENQMSTIIYRCSVYRHERLIGQRFFKLYVDHLAMKRGTRGTRREHCRAPRCKPYASVKEAHCSRIELEIHYPRHQYGYNQSIDYWGTVTCNDQVHGYQLWLIGYGIVKRFRPDERIILDNLIPGKRYCFNGWAFNHCGPGPVFTLEGVCAANTADCRSPSDEHCELDFDYSY